MQLLLQDFFLTLLYVLLIFLIHLIKSLLILFHPEIFLRFISQEYFLKVSSVPSFDLSLLQINLFQLEYPTNLLLIPFRQTKDDSEMLFTVAMGNYLY